MSREILSIRNTLVASCLCLLVACTKEPPPPKMSDFLEDPILLEATMVRCAQNRSQTKYEAECVAAKQAANRLAAAEERERKAELEKQSARKRQALRRAQEARTEARRRAAEEERLRREAEYLGVFDEIVVEPGSAVADGAEPPPQNDVTSNAPVVREEPLEPPQPPQPQQSQQPQQPQQPQEEETPRQAEVVPPGAATGGDLETIRDELRRRQESDEQ